MYNVLEFRVTREGDGFVSSVMTEGQINDVAVYEIEGEFYDKQFVARHGHKIGESTALLRGWKIPEGKHYRR